ncbi:MAG: hypothetical protein AAF078_06645, partial [Planctomycetota bacterium]
MPITLTPLRTRLLLATSLAALLASGAMAQTDCALVGGEIPADCPRPDAGDAVAIPAAPNTEFDDGAVAAEAAEGFLISIDGEPVSGDLRIEDEVRAVDTQLERANVQVRFDGLGATPRLSLEALGPREERLRPGDTVTVQSRMNYPAFVERGEIRVIDLGAPSGPRTLLTAEIAPGGQAAFAVPEGENVVVVHRVYDARGRFDETAPLSLNRPSDDYDDAVDPDLVAEEGRDDAIRRRIPVNGGAVTVSGTQVRPGAQVFVMGEEIATDASGAFVVERILPKGEHAVPVNVEGAGEHLHVERDITIPASEWFYVATADLTFGRRFGDDVEEESYSRGRLAFYAKGKTATGWTITGSADTREEDLDELFDDFDKKDPRSLLDRFDSDDAYPTFGDDSTIVEDAPTAGRFYLRAEKNGSHLQWGTYRNEVSGTQYLRNERTLYGLQGVYRSPATTERGESRVEATLYAAQPDSLPGRDVFLGTGGSIYFLQRQDISDGSETVSVEVRDRDTGRVIERRTLVYGRDYDINYIQGVVTLSSPLSSSAGGGTVVTDPAGEFDVQLTVQYEFTPTSGDLDGFAYGGRGQVWVTDAVRLGVTRLVEQTDSADQTATGADIRLQFGENTWIEAEYARTEGPGFGASFSNDGGLIVNTTDATGGDGEAYFIKGQADLLELGFGVAGTFSAYAERRTAGFSTLDYQTSVDEELWGFDLELRPTEDSRYRIYADDFSNEDGKERLEAGLEYGRKINDRLEIELGVEHVDQETPGVTDETGQRTDLAARVTVTESDRFSWYGFAQTTLDRSGGLERNDRFGVGAKLAFAEHWTFEGEISDGTAGAGGRILFSHDTGEGNSTYVGYEVLPGRELAGTALRGQDNGRVIAGAKRVLSPDVDIYGENTYDLFGTHRALTSIYGVTYKRSDALAYDLSVELGRIDDEINGDFERTALSFGTRYSSESLTARARLEYRKDRGVQNGTNRDADTLLLSASARYQIDESQRLVFDFDGAVTDTDESSIPDADYAEANIGYAYRPVDNDKLNVLFRYTYLYDMYGQQIDGTTDPGPQQESHVLSFDATYDLNRHWTLGGKVGVRKTRSAPDGDTALQDNDAWLAILEARYHLV